MKKRYYFAIKANRYTQAESLLDMLRYDSATVHKLINTWWLLSSEKQPTRGRWSSFGIEVHVHVVYGTDALTLERILRDE